MVEERVQTDCKHCTPGTTEVVARHAIPFYCPTCGNLRFTYRTVNNVLIVYPLQENLAVVLSVGMITEGKAMFFPGDLVVSNSKVRWTYPFRGGDGKEHEVLACSVEDVAHAKEAEIDVYRKDTVRV